MNPKPLLHTFFVAGFALASLTSFSNQAHAQGGSILKSRAPLKEFYTTQRGSGSARREGKATLALNSVTVELKSNNQATIKLQGRDSYELFGSWRNSGTNSISLDYQGGALRSSKTSGKGTIELRDNRLYKLSLQGKFGGDDFSANFTASDSSGGGGGSNQPTFEARAYGSGVLDATEDRDRTINEIQVRLEKDGDASVILKIKSGGQYRLRGKWQRGLLSLYSVRGLSGDGIENASGILTRQGNGIKGLTLNGRLKKGNFKLNFRQN